MWILYLGAKGGTALQRASALERIGHEVLHLDPERHLPNGGLGRRFHYETGGLFAGGRITSGVLADLADAKGDAVWVDSGRYISAELVEELRARFGPVVLFNHDNPFVRRDRFSWELQRKSLHAYDACVFVRHVNMEPARQMGAKEVLIEPQCADEVAHAPLEWSEDEREAWAADATFVGTWMEDRGAFLASLLSRSVPLTIYGQRWERAREWPTLEPAVSRKDTLSVGGYAKALQGGKVCIGLLSAGNQDQYTSRSMEAPYMGVPLCAKRTEGHLSLYDEGTEALFWEDAEECAAQVSRLLEDEPYRQELAKAGQRRCIANGHLNEQMMTRVLGAVCS